MKDSRTEDSLAELLGLADVSRASVLLDSSGVVRFAAAAVISPDVARQLAERALNGRAANGPPTIPLDAGLWHRRILGAELQTLDRVTVAPSILLEKYRHIAVFDAYCSVGRVRSQLLDLAIARDSIERSSPSDIAGIIPAHYLASMGRAVFDSVPIRWFVARRTIAPELALITRDAPESAPLLLRISSGVVEFVSSVPASGRW